MNSTKIASRLMFLSGQCRGEAQHQTGTIRDELIARARQLTYAMHQAYSQDPDVQAQAIALIEATIDCLVDVVTARATTRPLKGTP